MKKIIYIGLAVLPLLASISCSEIRSHEYVNDSGQAVVEEFYGKNRVKSRTIYLNDRQTDYILINFYEDGILKDSSCYSGGKLNGKRVFFAREEDLLYEEHYSDGILNGIQWAEYSNGVSSFEGYRRNGKMAGLWRFHYPDGKLITYEFYDSTGLLQYFKKYTDQGIAESTKGDGIISLPFLADSTPAGISVGLRLLVATPPFHETSLSVKVSTPGRSQVIIFNQTVSDEELELPFTFPVSGKYTFYFELTIHSPQNDATELYSAEKSFNI